MTAFSLERGPVRPMQSWRLVPWLLYFTWLQLDLIRSKGGGRMKPADLILFALLFVVPLLYLVLAKPRSRASIQDQETKEVADYMVRLSRSSSPPPLPAGAFFHGDANHTLYDRCRFPRDCAVDPDTGLAYIFCRLLARRYFGFPCAEYGDAQVRDFVLTELLADWNKAFTTVEVQLALLHDYFFTNYHSILTSGLVSSKQAVVAFLRDSLSVLAGVVLTLAIDVISGRGLQLVSLSVSVPLGLVVAYVVILQAASPVLPAHWHPIRNIILYYPYNNATARPPTIDRIVPPRRRSSSSDECSRLQSQYWKGKMGQYSVMEDYDRRSFNKALIAWCKVHVLSHVSYSFIKHHPAEEEDVGVPDCVKRFVARTVQQDMMSSMGTTRSSLGVIVDTGRQAQNDDHYTSWSWICRQETLTHTILIWHVATCYCDMMMSQETVEDEEDTMSRPLEERSTEYRKVATTLSRYCAYLVAFLPELLPEPSLTALVVLHEVLQETRDLMLVGTTRMPMQEKRTTIQGLPLPRPEDDGSGLNTFEKGVWLGRQLQQVLGVSSRWKAMADFWAKTILYIASADNAAAHIEQLTHGGEFVTHIWALLCNAGILKEAAEAWNPSTGTYDA